MKNVIWTCWFQGRASAPDLVAGCLRSWEAENPGWEVRCLDARTVERHVDIRRHVDLDRQEVTAASLSDILRILLLEAFGGVWVDATLFCNRSLDPWLSPMLGEGFFAFRAPAPERPLSSWFIAAEAGNPLVSGWADRTRRYWARRARADRYFWFHQQFAELCGEDAEAAARWARVPAISAVEPHAMQEGGRMYRPMAEVRDAIDWTLPVFKLTHRLGPGGIPPDSLLAHVLARHGVPDVAETRSDPPDGLGREVGPIAPASLLMPG